MNVIEPIYPSDLNDALISDLSNRPNSKADSGDGGLSAKELKERFDKYPSIVMKKLNEIIRAFNSDDATSYVKMPSNDLGESFCDFLSSYFDPEKKKDIGDLVCAEYMKENVVEQGKYTLNSILDDVASHIKNVGLAIADVKNIIEELASASDQIDDEVIAALTSRIVSLENIDSYISKSIIELNDRAATLEEYINAGGGNLPPGSEIGEVIVDRQTAYTRTVPLDASTTALLDRYYGESEVVCNYSPVSMTTVSEQYPEFTISAYPPGNIKNLELSIHASLPSYGNGFYGSYGLEILVNDNSVYKSQYIYKEEFYVEFAVEDLAPEVKIRLFTMETGEFTVSLSNIRLVEAGSKRGVTGISTINLNSIESSTGDTVEIPQFGHNGKKYNDKMYSGNYVDFSEKVFVYKTRYFYDASMTKWKRIDTSTFRATYSVEDLGLQSGAIIASASSTYGNSYKDGVAGTRVVVAGTYIDVYAYVNAKLDSLTDFLDYMSKIRFGIIYTLSDAESNADIVLQPIDQSFVEIPVEPGGTLTFHSDKEGQAYDATIFYLKAKDEEEEPPEGGGEDPTPPEGGGDEGDDEPPTVDPEETRPEVEDAYDIVGASVGESFNENKSAYERRVPNNVTTEAAVEMFYYDTIMNYNIAPVNKFSLQSSAKEFEIYPDKSVVWEVSFDAENLGARTLLCSVSVGESQIASYEANDGDTTKHSFTFNYSSQNLSQSSKSVKVIFSISPSSSEEYTIDNLCIIPSGERRTTRSGHPISIAPTKFIGANGITVEIPALVGESAKRVAYAWEKGIQTDASVFFLGSPRIEGAVELYTDDPYDTNYPWKMDEANSTENVNVFYKNIPSTYFVGSISNYAIRPNVFTTSGTSGIGHDSAQNGTSLKLTLRVHKSIDLDKLKQYLKAVKFNFLVRSTATISLDEEEAPKSKNLEVAPGGIITIESNVLYHSIFSQIRYVIAEKDSGGDSGGEDPTPPEEVPGDAYALAGTVGETVTETKNAYVRRVPSNVGESAVLSKYYGESVVYENYASLRELTLNSTSTHTVDAYPPVGEWDIHFNVNNSSGGTFNMQVVVNGVVEPGFAFSGKNEKTFLKQITIDEPAHVVLEFRSYGSANFDEPTTVSNIYFVRHGAPKHETAIVPVGLERIISSTGDTVEIPITQYNDKMLSLPLIPSTRASVSYDSGYSKMTVRNPIWKIDEQFNPSDWTLRTSLTYTRSYFRYYSPTEMGTDINHDTTYKSWYSTYGYDAENWTNHYQTDRVGSRGAHSSGRTWLFVNVHKDLDTVEKFCAYMKAIGFSIIGARANLEETPIDVSATEIPVKQNGALTFESTVPDHPVEAEIDYLIVK